MKKTVRVLACLAIIIGLWACEQPKSPDFQLNHDIEAPLTANKTYPFLGGSDALIDSTSEDFADLFSTDSDGLVQLSKEQEFEFGDLNDAIPEVDVPSTSVDPEVGEIELTNLASSGTIGSVSVQDITGSSNLQKGDPVPDGKADNIKISDFDPDFFESATIKNKGAIHITIANNLGFNANDRLNITLLSNGSPVGSDDIYPLNHKDTKTAEIVISAGTQLSNLGVEIDIKWSGDQTGDQKMQDDAGSLEVTEVVGQDDSDPSKGLIASQVTAAIEPQEFSSSDSSTMDNSDFQFQDPGDFVELSSNSENNNSLTVDITNNIAIGIDTLDITFPEIKDPQGNPLELNLPPIAANGSYNNSHDISGHRITSDNIKYNIEAVTENTQDDTNVRTINETDQVNAEVSLSNLEIGRAKGYISPRDVFLNDDVTNDGRENLDVFIDDEAEITNVDGLSDISDRISDITFENPILTTKYLTNLGVNTTIYAAIVGTDSKDNKVYLKGKDGSQYDVTAAEIPAGLEANGQTVTEDQVIKFSLQTADNPDPQQGEEGENEFNADNSNSSEFFSNLPTKIRFAGIARVNNDQESGEVVNPVIFDPTMNFDLPFNFSANNASFKDTLDADLGDLPGDDDDRQISEATFIINYTNGLPLDLDLAFIMIDENGSEVTRKSDINVGAATTNSEGVVESGGENENKVEIGFSEEELKQLNKTRSLVLDIGINTSQQNAVKINGSDSINFHMQMKVQITSTVN